jgi:dienelactone hydrolase
MIVPPVGLEGDLVLPDGARAVVVFAHGSGSSRLSPRNRQVAEVLQEAGIGTLLMDLLTPDEGAADERTGHLRFNIDLLANRLTQAVDWIAANDSTSRLPVGCFGASTGAAAALVTAARRPDNVRAVVSRGGRPDLAGPMLALVDAPTLLIIGGRDRTVLELNRQAFDQLRCEKDLQIVPGATHLFEEPGALDKAAALARGWFVDYLHASR